MTTVKTTPTFWKLTRTAAAHAVVSFCSPLVNIWTLIAKEPRAETATAKRVEPELLKS